MAGNKPEERDVIKEKIISSLEKYGCKHIGPRKSQLTRIWKYIYSELNRGMCEDHFSRRTTQSKNGEILPFFELEFVLIPSSGVFVKTIRKNSTHIKYFKIEKEFVTEIVEKLNAILRYYYLEIIEEEYTHLHQSKRTYYIIRKL